MNTGKETELTQAARQVVANSKRGVLATLQPETGFPYASLVELLPLPNGEVVLLLSRLAEHQQYAAVDDRVSLLLAPEMESPNALARPRVTLLGHLLPVAEKELLLRPFTALHPSAVSYAIFTDFAFYRLAVTQVRYIAGFGGMGWIAGEVYRG